MNAPHDSVQESLLAWIASGDIIVVVLIIMAAEILVLGALRLRRGTGMPIGELLANSVAGGSLALAVRSALLGEDAIAVAAWLVMAAVGHTSFMVIRLRAGPAAG